ncbi:MAG: hypothetical protein BRC43_09155 [Cyanobacteria bacterium QS_3_48_167]|nr:MAG: hypothetical protein BRC43_09155 [Cyanobacteria bacterium QS_3_48_167]
MQCDELWSFVDDRGKQQWVCLGLDAETPEVVGVYVSTQIVESLPSLSPRRDTRSARHASGISPTLTFGQLMQQCFQANGIR